MAMVLAHWCAGNAFSRTVPRRRAPIASAMMLLSALGTAQAANIAFQTAMPSDLIELSLEQLMTIEVTSVAKKA